MRKYEKSSKAIRELVHARINILFDNAKEAEPDRARHYVEMARKLSTRNKVHMPRGSSRLFCRNCNSFFKPGKNVRIRTREGKLIYVCQSCKHIRRYPMR